MALSEGGLSGDDFVGTGPRISRHLRLRGGGLARQPGVVWVEGEAGSGKTALVRQAVKALPVGFFRGPGQADELAADIAYELALQLGAVDAEGPFVAGMSLLEAWSTAQDDGPVAVCGRRSSLGRPQLVTSAAERSEAARSGPGAGGDHQPAWGRRGPWERFVLDSERCHRLVLADFDVDEVAALAAAKGVELTHRQAVRLHAHTRGHPCTYGPC